jgi:glycosyltransferase involved in cell wall biosynthesis
VIILYIFKDNGLLGEMKKKQGTIYFLMEEQGIRDFSFIQFLRAIKHNNITAYLKSCFVRNDKPIGGVKVIYQHCLALKKAGLKAEIIKLGKYEGNFFGYNITLVDVSEIGFELNKNDVIVGTEFRPYTALNFKNAQKVLFAQHWGGIERAMCQEDKLRGFHALGYNHIIAVSNLIVSKLIEGDKTITTTIINGIDLKVFKPNTKLRIKNRILALSRKNPKDLESIKELLHKSNSDVDLIVVDGLTEAELVIEYQKSDIFLATGYPEGFGLPPLEAMACGCVVVGFSGGGGLEYMENGLNSLVADDGDVSAASEYILSCLDSQSLKDKLRTNGLKSSLNFSVDVMNSKIIETYNKILS